MAAEDWIDWFDWDDYDCYGGPPPPDKTIKYNQIIARTEKAIMFEDDTGSFWMPKSVIKINRFKKTVIIQGWVTPKIHYMERKPPEYLDPREVRKDVKESQTQDQ